MNPPRNVVPFQRPSDPLAFAPGVIPFDRGNPAHIAAWNAVWTFARHEARREGRT